MKKTWEFFKLRMMQLKADKTGLFFAYVFPVLLLLGIGYPLQMMGDTKIKLAYADHADNAASAALVEYLSAHKMIRLVEFPDKAGQAVRLNEVGHFLEIVAAPAASGGASGVEMRLNSNSLPENEVGNLALKGVLEDFARQRLPAGSALTSKTVEVSPQASYLAILLPGIIGMTLLIIGLGGFGAVLIEEEHQGIFKNLKTIDVSPASFLSGLFLSRLLVAYTVAAGLLAISAATFDLPIVANVPLLLLVVTLGSVTFLGLGLVISSFSPSVVAFNGIINVVQLPLVLLGGVFFSITAFPQWAQQVATCLPLTQFNTALRESIFGAAGNGNIGEIYPELAGLALWAAGLLLLAKLKFKW